jgi:hypothetical protein
MAMVEQRVNVRQSPAPAKPSEVKKGSEVKTVVATTPRKDKVFGAVKNAQTTTLALAKNTQDKTMAIVKNPQFQTVTVSTAGGAVTFGAVGGAFGCMGGVMVGGMMGTVPLAFLTFGTSIPFGAMVGGALGSTAGATAGGLTGAAVGGVTGQVAYVYRAQIKDGYLRVKVVTEEKTKKLKLSLKSARDSAQDFALDRTNKVKAFALERTKKTRALALEAQKKGYAVVCDKRFQVTTAAAAGGAVTCGAAGGAVGTAAGAGTGALVGLPAALFTFGLSIPVCATIGGGLGCAAGATTGATAGGVAGGAAGYNGHKYRKEIAGGASKAWDKVQTSTNKLKIKAMDSVTQVTAMVSGTGGTAGGAGSE